MTSSFEIYQISTQNKNRLQTTHTHTKMSIKTHNITYIFDNIELGTRLARGDRLSHPQKVIHKSHEIIECPGYSIVIARGHQLFDSVGRLV